MSGVSIRVVDRGNLLEKMNAIGPESKGALHGGLKAMGVFLATKIRDASPTDTHDMQESIGVSLDHVEQVAPYTYFVDLWAHHFSGVYESASSEALEVAAATANDFLATGRDARSVPSPFPAQGHFKNRRGRTRFR